MNNRLIPTLKDMAFSALLKNGLIHIEMSEDSTIMQQNAAEDMVRGMIIDKLLPNFLWAIKNGNKAKVKELLDKVPVLLVLASPTLTKSGLTVALETSQPEMVKLLLPYYKVLEDNGVIDNAREVIYAEWMRLSSGELALSMQKDHACQYEIIFNGLASSIYPLTKEKIRNLLNEIAQLKVVTRKGLDFDPIDLIDDMLNKSNYDLRAIEKVVSVIPPLDDYASGMAPLTKNILSYFQENKIDELRANLIEIKRCLLAYKKSNYNYDGNPYAVAMEALIDKFHNRRLKNILKGSGLGLNLVREMCEQYPGQMQQIYRALCLVYEDKWMIWSSLMEIKFQNENQWLGYLNPFHGLIESKQFIGAHFYRVGLLGKFADCLNIYVGGFFGHPDRLGIYDYLTLGVSPLLNKLIEFNEDIHNNVAGIMAFTFLTIPAYIILFAVNTLRYVTAPIFALLCSPFVVATHVISKWKGDSLLRDAMALRTDDAKTLGQLINEWGANIEDINVSLNGSYNKFDLKVKFGGGCVLVRNFNPDSPANKKSFDAILALNLGGITRKLEKKHYQIGFFHPQSKLDKEVNCYRRVKVS